MEYRGMVPDELSALPQWINWRYIGEDRRKVPFNPRNGDYAKTNDPSTWSTLEQAQVTGESLGFVFSPDDGLFGIDLDGCIASDGVVQEWAIKIVDQLATYAEISPSGSGIKLWGRGYVGAGRKRPVDAIAVAGKPPQIEVYDRGRYFAFTGQPFGEARPVRECQAELDALLAHYWPPAPAPVERTTYQNPMDIRERAARYLAVLPPAISGCSGHNATFRAACVLVLGFGLRPETAFPLLSDWNQLCQPPWSDKELWHKLGDADKREGDRGWLLRDGGRYEGPDVDLRALLSSLAPTTLGVAAMPSAKPVESQFPSDCLRVSGLIGDLMDYTLRTSIYPQPELALAAAIAMAGTITGRKVRDERGTRTNVYVMGLCPPASGKERARAVNKEAMLLAGAEAMLGPESIGSSAGLITAIHAQPAILFQLDEIGRLFQTMQSATKATHLFNVGSQLLKLYSSADQLYVGDAYADPKKTKRINQPHACVYGTSVPDVFWGALTTENVTEGLVGRFMVFDSSLGYVMPRDNEQATMPESIVRRIRWWLDYWPGDRRGNLDSLRPDANPSPQCVPFAPGATERMREHIEAIAARRRSESLVEAALWSRSAEKAGKLALIYACSRADCAEPTEISLNDVNLAIRTCNWLTRRMLSKVADHVSDGQHDARIKKAWRAITDGMTMSEFTRKTQWMKDRRERSEVLAHLVEIGNVSLESSSEGSKTTTRIRKAAYVQATST